jgi:hypothetical protein
MEVYIGISVEISSNYNRAPVTADQPRPQPKKKVEQETIHKNLRLPDERV